MKLAWKLLVLWCLVPGAPAWAASELEALRAEAQSARAQASRLRERQQSLQGELEGLAGRIATLKAERQGRLVMGGELEGALRRSQELSSELTGLAQALAGAEADSQRRALALHAALSAELARVRAAWDATTDRQPRATLLERLRSLRAEREAVRAALPPSQVPALDKADVGDDPEDLLEQADALRDSQDKVRQRLEALRARITEVREEKELDRRMNDFLGEESLFDEQDRRLRVRADPATRAISVDRTSPSSPLLESVRGAPTTGAPPPSGGGDVSTSPELGGISGPPPARAADARPQVGAVQGRAAGGGEDLRSLEAEAARLESLARELEGRASALERRARELE